MGQIASVIRRPFRDFNLESRVFKTISKEKPTVAPKYPSDRMAQEQLLRDYPKEFEESLQKNEMLDAHLKNVYVTSKDPQVQAPPKSSSAERPLPLDRSQTTESDFGFREPEKVPYGKVTLRSALKLILKHQNDPAANSIKNIATEYNLPEDIVGKLVKYYKIFAVYVPENKSNANFVGPIPKRQQVITQKKDVPLISESKKKTDDT